MLFDINPGQGPFVAGAVAVLLGFISESVPAGPINVAVYRVVNGVEVPFDAFEVNRYPHGDWDVRIKIPDDAAGDQFQIQSSVPDLFGQMLMADCDFFVVGTT